MHKTLLQLIIEFDWDEGNLDKSRRKHNVSPEETEEIFDNAPFVMLDDVEHSTHEKRFQALGKRIQAESCPFRLLLENIRFGLFLQGQ